MWSTNSEICDVDRLENWDLEQGLRTIKEARTEPLAAF